MFGNVPVEAGRLKVSDCRAAKGLPKCHGPICSHCEDCGSHAWSAINHVCLVCYPPTVPMVSRLEDSKPPPMVLLPRSGRRRNASRALSDRLYRGQVGN